MANTLLAAGAVPVKGERGSRPRRYVDLDLAKATARAYAQVRSYRPGQSHYQNQIVAQNKYQLSAGRYPRRSWEAWEREFVLGNPDKPCRLLALGLQRSIRSVQMVRADPQGTKRRARNTKAVNRKKAERNK